MHWLREHGLVSNYADRAALPATVLEDAQLYMSIEGEHLRAQQEKQRAAAERAGRGLSGKRR